MEIDFSLPAPVLARQLIGCELNVSDMHGTRGGVIIETEAYTAYDPASHSFRGPTARNQAMFMTPGTLYMYRIYGIHYCLNIVCGKSDGQAVLLRALRPKTGLAYMRYMRGTDNDKNLCNGPAKLVQALGLEYSINTYHISDSAIRLVMPTYQIRVGTGRRIGISKATEVAWRFFEEPQNS